MKPKYLRVHTTIKAGGKCNDRCKADGYKSGSKDAFGTCWCWDEWGPTLHENVDQHKH